MNLAYSSVRLLAVASLVLAGCAGSEKSSSSSAAQSDPNAPADVLSDLKVLPTPEGGMSFYTPVIHVKPGEDVTYCTFTKTIADHDLFVHSTRGSQSKWGHHSLLFFAPAPVDPHTEICTGQSMESLRQMIGGGGGEGTATWAPPENVGTIVPRGSQLVLQSHWINTGEQATDVQAMMITEPGQDGPGRIEAGTLTVLDLGFQVPPRAPGSTTTECMFESDFHMLMSIGHEHEWGTHVRAEVTRADGKVESLFDRPFSPSDVFDPPINGYTVEQPLVISKGDTLRMSCDWQNTTDEPLGFPREMCVFFGFTMDPGDARCINGGWMAAGTSGDGGVPIAGPPCAAVSDPGNDQGVGKYCTKQGGECSGTGAALCLADYTTGGFGDFCTKLCSSDDVCGSGAVCIGASGSPKICMPTSCLGVRTSDGGAPEAGATAR